MVARDRQAEQYSRFKAWSTAEGTMERPLQLDTVLKPHQRARYDWLKANVTGTVLEVGCNWGYALAYVGGQAGVDINPDLVALAQLLARDREFKVGDARALPYPDKSFDTVMLPDVLEHLEWADVGTAIAEATRVARHRVLVTVPNGDLDNEDTHNQKHRHLLTHARFYDVVGTSPQILEGFYCGSLWLVAPTPRTGPNIFAGLMEHS